jgi:hypothetical protein
VQTDPRTNYGCLIAFIGLCGFGAVCAADTPVSVDETSKSAAAVIAVDKHWGDAEVSADDAYLNQLLLPEYRTVNPAGIAHGKSTTPRKPATPAQKAQMDAWRSSHPEEPRVLINGDTAILTWTAPAVGSAAGVVRSVDIFLYRSGHWHAFYSQHSDASKED